MSGPFFFGERSLFGMLHAAAAPSRGALLLCAPLLQEGIRSHRALWALAEQAARSGIDAMCFDWYGSGDSAGDGPQATLQSLLDDLREASSELLARAGAGSMRWLGLRSAALPLQAYLATQRLPVDLVLWDPQLDGGRVVEAWRSQHVRQIGGSGRYPFARREAEPDELLGFEAGAPLLHSLDELDAARLPLPPGSRVRLAVWETDDDVERYVRTQRACGVAVETIELDRADRPDWDDPRQFGSLVFPRRSVAQLAGRLSAAEAR
jgi:hypothetical protein